RARGTLTGLITQEPIRMTAARTIELTPPRFVDLGPLLIAGLGGRYSFDTNAGIPVQWQRFNRDFHGRIPNQKGNVYYGVSHDFDDDRFDYLCGAEVTSFAALPGEFARISIPAHRYAVFTHGNHISSISATHYAIMAEWAPNSGVAPPDVFNFERYDNRFDPMTGLGGVEIWLPLAR
ncbi:MAG TPA: GyrI-like domain-containing protein, partial [Opitutus sp.]|nr:GyrI-like domain-containing protein [Opitutus sp.]